MVDIQADFWNGDPDIDAICRMEHRPDCDFDPACFPIGSSKPAPFNSQNTFLSAKVLPHYFLFPHVGRMDDIWASYYVQALGFRVVFNKSSVYQERNAHNLTHDMRQEYLGYEHNLEIPAFFSSDLYRQYLAPGETVLMLPFGLFGEGMLWQAATDMYFRMAGGYVGPALPMPEEDSGWPIMFGLYNLAGVPDAGDQLKAYLANHDVGAIIVGPRTQYLVLRLGNLRTAATWLRWPTIERERIATGKLLASLDAPPLEVGGITLYRIPPSTLALYRQLTAIEMQRRAAGARFDALFLGTERHLSQGHNPAALTPQVLESLGLVPLDWFGGKPFPDHDHVGNPIFDLESILSASNNGAVKIGIKGRYAALKPTIDRYSAQASAIYFPYPLHLTPTPSLTDGAAMMVMEFDRTGLAHAAAPAATGGEEPRKPAAAPSAALAPTVPASNRPGDPKK